MEIKFYENVWSQILNSFFAGEDRSVDYESAAGLFALLQASLLLHKDKLKLMGINDLSRTGNFSHIILSAADIDKKNSPVVTFEDEEMKREWAEHDVRYCLPSIRLCTVYGALDYVLFTKH